MAKISRDRGARFEREVVSLCNDYGYPAFRTAQHKGKTGKAADVEGVPGLHIEAKRRRSIGAYEWVHQAVEEASAEGKGNIPVVFCRADGERMLAVMLADDFMQFYREWEAGEVLKETDMNKE